MIRLFLIPCVPLMLAHAAFAYPVAPENTFEPADMTAGDETCPLIAPEELVRILNMPDLQPYGC